MNINLNHVFPLSDFKRKQNEILEIAQLYGPVLLTLNGTSKCVVMSPDDFQKLNVPTKNRPSK